MRAYLAWWVVAFHTLTTAWYKIPELPMPVALLGAGDHAVTIFMILSGFVICRLLDLRQEPYPQYILRRFLRIYPVFVASGMAMGLCLFAFSLSNAENLAIWPLGTLERYLIKADSVFDNLHLHLLLNAVMLHGVPSDTLLPAASFGFNPVAWSLSLEWQFYLIAPALVLVGRLPTHGPAVVGGVVLAIFATSAFVGPHQFPSFLPLSILWFALGMFSWILYRNRTKPGMLKALAFTAAGLSAVALVLCFGIIQDRPVVGARNVALPAAIWMTFLALLIARERSDGAGAQVFRFFFESRVALALGQCSYSTYLWHRVILWLVMIGMAELLGSADSETLIWASTPLSVLLVVAVSLASYRYIEAPPITLAQRLTQRSSARPARAAQAG